MATKKTWRLLDGDKGVEIVISGSGTDADGRYIVDLYSCWPIVSGPRAGTILVADHIAVRTADMPGIYDAAEARREELRVARIEMLEIVAPGLAELKHARALAERYRDSVRAMMEDEGNDGACPPQVPEVLEVDLVAKYPAAVAYLEAEAWEESNHHAKSAAGARAREKIEHGENVAEAVATMRAEWSEYCDEHAWA